MEISTRYIIELTRWSIKNDFTNPDATTKGINDALVWAKDNGYTYVKLPAGNYAIAMGPAPSVLDGNNEVYTFTAANCILPQSDTVLDLSDCTLRKETNGWSKYNIIHIENKQNVTLLSGVLQGDRLAHNYAKANYEGCNALLIGQGAYGTKVYDVEIKDCPGYNLSLTGQAGQLDVTVPADFSSGTFDASGAPSGNAAYTRINRYFTLASIKNVAAIPANGVPARGTDLNGGYFVIFGDGYGSFGTRKDGQPVVLSRVPLELYCYDNAKVLKGKLLKRPYDQIYLTELPAGTTQFKITFRYDFTKIINSTLFLMLDFFYVSQRTEIKNCKIHDGYCLGIGITGSQQVLIENNDFYNIGYGTAVAGKVLYPFPMGIDIEDGGNINQSIIIRNNRFRQMEGNLAVSAVHTRNILLENNFFDTSGVSFNGTRGTGLMSKNNIYFRCAGTGQGNPIFDGDTFTDTLLNLEYSSTYQNCNFENVQFQFTGWTAPNYTTTQLYALGIYVLPTTKDAAWLAKPLMWTQTFNNSAQVWGGGGTYNTGQYVLTSGNVYTCATKGPGVASNQPTHTRGTAGGADGYTWTYIGTNVEPAWSPTGGQTTDVFGNKWDSALYEIVLPYSTFSFSGCNISWTKPEIVDGFSIRRGNVELDNCKFNLEITNRFFSDGSDGWDYISKNSWALCGCSFLANTQIGGIGAPKVLISKCSFTGTKDIVTQGGNAVAGVDVTIEGCTFTNFDLVIRGSINMLTKSLHFVNNKQFLGKTVNINGWNTEGVLIANFDNVFLEGNKAFITAKTTGGTPQQARPFMIFVEKFLKLVDNYVESNHATMNKLELYGGLRNAGWTVGAVGQLPTASIVHIDNNHVSQYGLFLDTSLLTQLKKYTGDGLTDINAVGVGSTSMSTIEPVSGSYVQGQSVRNSAVAAAGTVEWVCVTSGIANNISWAASTAKALGARINVAGRVYECTVAGTTGATKPTWPTSTGITVKDNTVTWKDMGLKAVFRAL